MSKTNEAFRKNSNGIGTNIRTRRERLGLTQTQLAEKAKERFPDWKLSQTTLCRYEQEKYGVFICMSSFTFFRFCEILEVHSSELCLVNEGKKILPYKRKECLETKEKFKQSLSDHLYEFVILKQEKNHSKDSKNNKAIPFAEFYAKLCNHAKKLNYDESIGTETIYHYLNKERIPSLDYLFLICKTLEIELSELID